MIGSAGEEAHSVALISAEDLVALIRQHSRAPMGLEAYRSLFLTAGLADTDTSTEGADRWLELLALSRLVYATIAEHSEEYGAIRARDVVMLLSARPEVDGSTHDDIQRVLDTLSGDLLGVLDGSVEEGYRVTSSVTVAIERFTLASRLILGE